MKWQYPSDPYENDVTSLELQMSTSVRNRKNYLCPSDFEKDVVLAIAEEKYKHVRWHLRSDFFSYQHYLDAIYNLEGTSSPGYPLCISYATNNAYFGGVEKICWSQEKILEMWDTVNRMVNENTNPYFRVFVKNEPHKPEKAAEGRWRLIFAAPLAFQIIGHMLFDTQKDLELQRWQTIPSAYGLTLYHGGWKELRRLLIQKGFDGAVDKSAWDLNSPYWVYELKLRLRDALILNKDSKHYDYWKQLASWYYSCSYEKSKIVLTNGLFFQQTIPGIMKSGLPMTIDDNSSAQFFLHALACFRLGRSVTDLWAVGDDTIQSYQDLDAAYLRELTLAGCVVKEHLYCPDPEFVGFTFHDYGYLPNYLSKHFAAFMHQKAEFREETLMSYLVLYVHHPTLYTVWERVACSFGYHVYSKMYYRMIADMPRF